GQGLGEGTHPLRLAGLGAVHVPRQADDHQRRAFLGGDPRHTLDVALHAGAFQRSAAEGHLGAGLGARQAYAGVSDVQAQQGAAHGHQAGSAASTSGTAARASPNRAGSFRPACARSGLPPPPPPTRLETARTSLPASAPRSLAAALVLATMSVPEPTTTTSAPVASSCLSAAP